MRIGILVNAPQDQDLRSKIAVGLQPRLDYLALVEALQADLIAPLESQPSNATGKVLRYFKLAWAAFQRRNNYDLFISDVDRAGLLLALLFKFSNSKNRHIMICHGKIVQPWDLRLLQRFRLYSHIDCFVCYGQVVAQRLRHALQGTPAQIVTVRHGVDHRFWYPRPVPAEQMIVSAGRLRRDYSILIEAVQDLDLTVVLAPYSPWVPEDAPFVLRKLPRNVHVVRCSYYELRDLYARALAVAVPLAQSGTQSGSLVTYEAMATGKAVLVTRTQGQAGLGVVQEGDTGYYIPPGDVQGWRMAIQEMCAHPEKAAHMGRKAREVVETGLNLDCYVQDMTTIVRSALAKKELVKAHPTPGPERR